MALVKGTNSYVDQDETEVYFEDRASAGAFDSASDDAIDRALVTAARILDTLEWAGYASDEDQPMAFPRTGSYIDTARGRAIAFDADATEAPRRVKEGQFEMAFHILNNSALLDDTGRVDDVAVGSITLQDISSPSLLPAAVRRLIRPLLARGGSRSVIVGG